MRGRWRIRAGKCCARELRKPSTYISDKAVKSRLTPKIVSLQESQGSSLGQEEIVWKESSNGRSGVIHTVGILMLGGMGKESLVFYKRLANSLAEKRNQEYSATANCLRSRLSFCMIRPCLLCLRGSRSVFAKHVTEDVI